MTITDGGFVASVRADGDYGVVSRGTPIGSLHLEDEGWVGNDHVTSTDGRHPRTEVRDGPASALKALLRVGAWKL